MPSFDVKVKDEDGNEYTLQIDGAKTLAEAQAHADATAGVRLNETKVEDPPFVPEWQRSTIPPAPAKVAAPKKTTTKPE